MATTNRHRPRSADAQRAERRRLWSTLCPIGAFFLIGLCLFPVSGQDDFFITLWPAETLADQGQILNYNGEAVEQSSTLLLTLVLAALVAATGLEPSTLARLLSAACALLALAATPTALGLNSAESRWSRWLLALFAPFLYWASSGTEMPMVALALLLWVSLLHRRWPPSRLAPAFLLASTAVVTARPEGAFVLLAVLGALVGLDARSPLRRRWLTMALGVGLVLATVVAWRLHTFGLAWPLPVSAKVGGDSPLQRIASGLAYLSAWNGFGTAGLPLLAAALFGLALRVGRRLSGHSSGLYPETDPTRDVGPLAGGLVAMAYVGFAVTGGGDWMEGGRFIAPAAPFLASAAAHAVVSLNDAGRRRGGLGRHLSAALGPALIMLSTASILALAAHPKTRALPLWRAGQLADGPHAEVPWSERSNKAQLRDVTVLPFLDALVNRIARETRAPLVLTSHQMGYVAYRLSQRHPELRVIDAAGLVEPSLGDCAAIRDRVAHNAGGLWRKGHAYSPHLKVRFLLENVHDCAAELPRHRPAPSPFDVLYELGIPDLELLDRFSLTLVYVQDGTFLRRPSYTFVAVRTELARALALDSVQVVSYRSLGGVVSVDRRSEPLRDWRAASGGGP
ncbi:MAG: hypothetical protein AAGM22_27955 [Acidobacteriota bacterium]